MDVRQQINMTHLEEYIIEIIDTMTAQRKERNKYPDGVDMVSLQNRLISDLKAALNALCGKGIIVYYKTLNSVAFKIKQ